MNTDITPREHAILLKYYKGTFKLRTYANPEYPWVVGIPKRYAGGKRGRRFFKTVDEASEFIEEQKTAIKQGILTPGVIARYLPVAERANPQAHELSVDSRIGLLKQTVAMIARGSTPSAIVSGPGGLGKTHEVLQALDNAGLTRDKDFQLVKGYSSARGLYETLYNNNGRLVVLDDCDRALTDKTAVEILKGALDSYSTRTIAWLVKSKNADPDIPLSFDYTGRLIFITNKCLFQLDAALRTRCLVIDLQMTREEIFSRMHVMAANLPDYAEAQKAAALQFIESHALAIKNLSLRTLLMVLKIIKSNPQNWETLAKYTVTQG